jgi:hypothetical protein
MSVNAEDGRTCTPISDEAKLAVPVVAMPRRRLPKAQGSARGMFFSRCRYAAVKLYRGIELGGNLV